MSNRTAAILSEIESQRSFLGSRAAQHAGRIAELEAELAVAKAEVEAQRLRADEAEARLGAMPTPVDEGPNGR